MLARSAAVARTRLTRGITSSVVIRKDLVQDLYLREVKAYRPPPTPKDAHVGIVKSFAAPSTPQAPSLPSDFAAELAKYDAAEPVTPSTESQGATTSASGEVSGGAKEFLEFLEADFPKEEEAHH
ncbi:hypothetical protein M422DRAFT_782655 [Sphaerobolus stellatus SS14]|uniref:ATP synthase subunit H, mitochondrial n=1 Tax=Sphaerobolus stellatus (strain SS14) TaxID=990650 RepID=A0A0C9VCA4_SPHS4|nr:hypothetical protein M422DRAFT_782655 [Sphaerobolus stellatus SS14]